MVEAEEVEEVAEVELEEVGWRRIARGFGKCEDKGIGEQGQSRRRAQSWQTVKMSRTSSRAVASATSGRHPLNQVMWMQATMQRY